MSLRVRTRGASGLGLFMLLVPASAAASAPSQLGVPTRVPQVTGGQEVETCGWPNTVAVTGGGGLCSGSLVHPQVVVYAAHCGDENKQIRFSESSSSGGRTRQVQFCLANPDYLGTNDQASDWAFCVLEEPVLEIPFTPPLYGCELDMLEAGLEVAIAGFGDGGVDGPSGTKRWGMSQIVSTLGGTANIGGDGPSTCQGDSGSSAFVQMADGSWRSISMTSTGLIGCDQTTGVHALMHPAIPWIELNAQIDITPCHDLDGTWNPTPNCSGFFAGGSEGYGTWSDWCEGTPSTGPASTCGEPFDTLTDEEPPLVSITYPLDGEELESGSLVSIAIDAQDDGYGVNEVWVSIQGMEQPVRDAYPPYEFAEVPFPDGVYEIIAYAEDWAGNMAMSEPVTIGINAEVPDEPDPTGGLDETGGPGGTGEPDGTDTGAELDDPTGTGDPGAGDDGGGEGCGCRQGSAPGSTALWLLVMGVALGRRSRRRRA